MTLTQKILMLILFGTNLIIAYYDYKITRMNKALSGLVHGLITGQIEVVKEKK